MYYAIELSDRTLYRIPENPYVPHLYPSRADAMTYATDLGGTAVPVRQFVLDGHAGVGTEVIR